MEIFKQYRKEYGQNLYSTLCVETEEETDYTVDLDYHAQKHDEWYNREVLEEVSEQLGHSRVDVVVDNYLH